MKNSCFDVLLPFMLMVMHSASEKPYVVLVSLDGLLGLQ
jgi:hypothetical protein